jgi:hypothetical protein
MYTPSWFNIEVSRRLGVGVRLRGVVRRVLHTSCFILKVLLSGSTAIHADVKGLSPQGLVWVLCCIWQLCACALGSGVYSRRLPSTRTVVDTCSRH